MLGRQLSRIGEEAMRGSKAQYMPAGPSLVLRDVFAHPESSIADVTTRTGLPQSYVSESVARLRDQGIVETSADPADGRRTLVRVAPALAEALGEPADGAATAQIIRTLSDIAARLRPAHPGPIMRQLGQARK